MRDHEWYADGYNEFRAECRSCGQVIELNGGIVKNCDDAVMKRQRRPRPERARVGYSFPTPAWDLGANIIWENRNRPVPTPVITDEDINF